MLGPQAALNGSGVVVYDGSLYDRNDSVSATLSQPSQCLGWVTLASAAVGPQHWYDRLAANVEWLPRGNRAVALSTPQPHDRRLSGQVCQVSQRHSAMKGQVEEERTVFGSVPVGVAG